VICLIGDGGLQFSMGELAVPRDVDAWTAIVVWNNRGYGEIRSSMIAVGIRPEGVDVLPPDFALLAAAYGYAHRLIETPDPLTDLKAAVLFLRGRLRRLKLQPGQHRLKIGPACWIVGRAVGYDVGCRLQIVRLYRVRALDRE